MPDATRNDRPESDSPQAEPARAGGPGCPLPGASPRETALATAALPATALPAAALPAAEPKAFLSPPEIAAAFVESGARKAGLGAGKLLLLGLLAGAFIAFASEGSSMAAFNLLARPETYGLGRALAGAIFGTGLMLVVVAGGELFTGNVLILLSVLERRTRLAAMLRNWLLVYAGNLAGSLLVACMMARSGLFDSGASVLGGMTIKIASRKTALHFEEAFYLGVMCNWLVCLAVWMATAAKDVAGKLLAVFFPIWLFITSGFEHSVANMYYVPAGILAKANASWAGAALALGVGPEKLAALDWGSFAFRNLLPVTLGNIAGGGLFVAFAYWLAYLRGGGNSGKGGEGGAARP
ncbi:MAG TPA: formate/nitrite transporter family protein [Spirochaetales bacterium]|nr:formate/nitrite transporter family protein [Spirochaetales bacterium]